MSKTSKAKIEFILEMIGNIETILKRHDGIINTLEDSVESRPAVMMALMQIGESLKKVDLEFLEKYDLVADSKGAYNVRNFIAHDYDGVDMAVIENILRDHIPILKEKVLEAKKYFDNDSD